MCTVNSDGTVEEWCVDAEDASSEGYSNFTPELYGEYRYVDPHDAAGKY